LLQHFAPSSSLGLAANVPAFDDVSVTTGVAGGIAFSVDVPAGEKVAIDAVASAGARDVRGSAFPAKAYATARKPGPQTEALLGPATATEARSPKPPAASRTDPAAPLRLSGRRPGPAIATAVIVER
jgi:hypothetical protein